MSFILDTDTCSAYLRGDRAVFGRFVQYSGGLYDMFIAATALLHDMTVVTHNVRHFSPVPALRIVDWLVP